MVCPSCGHIYAVSATVVVKLKDYGIELTVANADQGRDTEYAAGRTRNPERVRRVPGA